MTKGAHGYSTEPRRRSLVDWLFRHEEINGAGRCPTYLHRWHLLRLPRGMNVYLHKFVGDDWSRDLHDHPKRFVSIGLWGSYVEWTPIDSYGDGIRSQTFRAPWFRTFPPEHIHRICWTGRPCWTLVFQGPTRRQWGFWHRGIWYPWETYLNTEHADSERSC